MASKVKCTCGWSWNKSDSSKKDMYICHECGRDNSNNMKNGGWLDNYNDYEVSAPEGFQGDGYSNVGRNSSPAWGGQFRKGGEIPNAQNGWLEKIDNVLSAPARAATYAVEAGAHAIGARKAPPKYEDPSDGLGIDEKEHPYLKLATDIVLDPTNLLGVGAISKIGKLAKGVKTMQKTKNVLQPTVKAAFDAATKAGKASGAITWGRNLGKQHKAFFKEYDVLLKNMYKPEVVEQALKLGAKDAIGATAIINDLIKQHPEKKEEILKNYKNITKQNISKTPKVIIKDYDAPQYKTIHTGEGEGRFEPVQRPTINAIQNSLQPSGLVYPDNDIEADIEIRNRAKIPKYYDVTDTVNQNFGGTESKYKYYPENGDLPNIAPSPYNTRTAVPHYQMGGSVYPVNYVPEAQTGGSFPGATGFSYARTGNIPSEGKYAKKTMASAQNGQEMQYYREGLDWKPKSISRDGSVIKDDRGQWDHPGEITEINSNEITMEGVPYNVLGISDTGDTKLMKPGKNYKFKGKKVTEFPMAKNGLRQEQKGLQNLDNLTNFTNYNTKQPGGWLNKYN